MIEEFIHIGFRRSLLDIATTSRIYELKYPSLCKAALRKDNKLLD